jgi:hypothetical protein
MDDCTERQLQDATQAEAMEEGEKGFIIQPHDSRCSVLQAWWLSRIAQCQETFNEGYAGVKLHQWKIVP